MRFKTGFFYRAGLLALCGMLMLAVWGRAQDAAANHNTNAVAPDTNAVAGVPLLDMQVHSLDFLSKYEFLQTVFLGQPLWKYLASLIYIGLAFLVTLLLDYVVRHWLSRLAARENARYGSLMVKLLRGPVKVIIFVILLNVGLGVFQWPVAMRLLISRGLIIVVACSLTYVVLKMVDLFLGVWRDRMIAADDKDKLLAEQLVSLVDKAGKAVIIIFAVLLTADNMGIDIKTVLAGLSVGGLALGLAAQDTVANLFGAVAVFVDKPFRVGDSIRVEGSEGTVETIGLRSTRIRNGEGQLVAVPNRLMGNATITNISRRPNIRTEHNIGLTYDTPVEKVRRAAEILKEVYGGHPQTASLTVGFNKFLDSTLNINVVHFWKGTNGPAQLAAMQEMNLQVKQRFDAEKIEFAFPSRTLYVKSEAAVPMTKSE